MKAGRFIQPKSLQCRIFGYKNHYHQNEKLRMYGAAHVCARDGFSGMIIECAAIQIKNTNNNPKKKHLQ